MNAYVDLTAMFIFFIFQADQCKELSDDEVDEKMPVDWWLTSPHCKYALTIKVHRHNSCFMKEPADGERGPSRKNQRSKAAERIAQRREEEREDREKSIQIRVDAQRKKFELEEKIANDHIRKNSIKREMDTIKICKSQLKTLRAMKDDYIKRHGEEAYDEKYGEYMDRLFNAQDKVDGNADGGDDSVEE